MCDAAKTPGMIAVAGSIKGMVPNAGSWQKKDSGLRQIMKVIFLNGVHGFITSEHPHPRHKVVCVGVSFNMCPKGLCLAVLNESAKKAFTGNMAPHEFGA
jgi:hypothetical protein